MSIQEATPRNDPRPNGVVLEGATGGRDENRICTFQVPMIAASIDDILTVGAESYFGLVESTRSWTALNDDTGSYIVTVTYKGYLNKNGSSSEPTEVETEQWGIDFDFSEEPIEAHPKIKEIVARYGGVPKPNNEDGFFFPPNLPKGKNSTGLGGKKLVGGDKNPMYGIHSFAVMQARVTRTYSSKTIKASLMAEVGSVRGLIPGAPAVFEELTPAKRNWLCQPPKISQNGDVYRITQEWLLSPHGGWPEEVYDLLDKS